MSFSEPLAVGIHDVSKRYDIIAPEDRASTIGEALTRRLRRATRRTPKQAFYALSHVSLEIRSGEALGIIGRNGAGKSTLLKIMSRVTAPTTGRVDLYGRVGSLLEVGTGFHPELTGRENVFLNGSILGMKKSEIRAQFDSIVDFAEIGAFLDTPVKRYSSGMYVRLAFAVAAHLDPDILIVDEVLAVGDVQFQRKCLGKMGEVTRQQGRTVLFVSHNMPAVEAICARGVVLDRGRVTFEGPTRSAIAHYLDSMTLAPQDSVGSYEFGTTSSAPAASALRRLEVRDADGRLVDRIEMTAPLHLTIELEGISPLTQMLSIRFKTDDDLVVAGVHSQLRNLDCYVDSARADTVTVSFRSLPLQPGPYWIELSLSEGRKGNSVIETIERAAQIEILPSNAYGSGWQTGRGARFGLVMLDPSWELRQGDLVVARSLHDAGDYAALGDER